jgi:hypothetical protein
MKNTLVSKPQFICLTARPPPWGNQTTENPFAYFEQQAQSNAPSRAPWRPEASPGFPSDGALAPLAPWHLNHCLLRADVRKDGCAEGRIH